MDRRQYEVELRARARLASPLDEEGERLFRLSEPFLSCAPDALRSQLQVFLHGGRSCGHESGPRRFEVRRIALVAEVRTGHLPDVFVQGCKRKAAEVQQLGETSRFQHVELVAVQQLAVGWQLGVRHETPPAGDRESVRLKGTRVEEREEVQPEDELPGRALVERGRE